MAFNSVGQMLKLLLFLSILDFVFDKENFVSEYEWAL